LAAVVIVLVLIALGGSRVSVTLDEPVDVASFNVFLESGWYVNPEVDRTDPLADASSNVFVYGPAIYSLAHVGFAGLSDFGARPAELSAGEQQTRKAVLVGLLGLAVAAMTWAMTLVTRRVWMGFVAGALLSAVPVFSGHAMFNMKDFPPAAGLVMIISGCISLSDSLSRLKKTKLLVGLGLISLGVFVAVGTRPAFILIVGVVAALTVLFNWLLDLRSHGTAWPRPAIGVVVALGLGYLALLILYPNLFGRPVSLLKGALNQASGFPWGGFTLTAGELAPNRPGLLYVFQWIGVQVPLVVTGFALIGGVWSLWFWFRCWRSRVSEGCAKGRLGLIGSSLWIVVFVGILATVVASNPVLYNGIRQLLFVLPALVFLAAFGLWKSVRIIYRRWGSGWAVGLVAGFLLLGVAIPTASHFRLFPYSYAGLNVLTMPQGIDGRWETDYWGVSSGELRTTAQAAKSEGLLPTSFSYPPDYCDEASYSGRWKEPGGSSDSTVESEAYYFCQVRTWGRNTPPEGCSVGWAVQRPQFWRQSTMSLIAKCPFTAAESPSNGIDFAVQSQDARLQSEAEPFLLWGWQISPELGIYSNSDSVGLGIELPTELRMTNLELDLDLKVDLPGGAPLEVMIRANGEEIGELRFTDDSKEQNARINIPAQVADRREGDLMVIRIDRIGSDEASGSSMFLFPKQLKLSAN